MSSIDAAVLQHRPPALRPAEQAAAEVAAAMPALPAPIVPPNSISGRALLGVIAIMSFLASLTLGGVVLVRTAAAEWQSLVSQEITIQLRPTQGRDLDSDIARASLITRGTPGVTQVRPYSREDSLRLLEPWLGAGVSLDELPVPRLIVVTIAAKNPPDLDQLRRALAEQVPGASVDDHRGFIERMRAVTRNTILIGLGVLGLMMVATVLLVMFATQGAMATNAAIVEVLHFVGAKNRYIAGQFQRHFLALGMKGAVLGGGMAVALFLLARFLAEKPQESAAGRDMQSLFGTLVLSADGYAGVVGVVILIAAVASITSRWTVHRTLNTLE